MTTPDPNTPGSSTTEREHSPTPGPWQVGGIEHDDWGIVRGPDLMPVANCGVLARYTKEEAQIARETNTTPPTVAANAALIASAPTLAAENARLRQVNAALVEACRKTVDDIHRQMRAGSAITVQEDRALRRLRTALRLAEGQGGEEK